MLYGWKDVLLQYESDLLKNWKNMYEKVPLLRYTITLEWMNTFWKEYFPPSESDHAQLCSIKGIGKVIMLNFHMLN